MANRYTGSPLGLIGQDFGGDSNPYRKRDSTSPNIQSLFSSNHTIFKRSNQSN